jgi:hypothetical protein
MKLLYSKAATLRILNLPKNTPVEVRVWDKVIWVHVKGQRPTLISKKRYHQQFADFRKQGAKKVKVYFTNGFKAEGNKEIYNLDPQDSFIDCGCADMQQQKDLWGRGCCKHGYALLSVFGYQTLKDYVLAKG